MVPKKISFSRWIEALEKRSERLVKLGLVLLSVFGLIYAISLGDRLRFLPDESDYLVLSQNLVRTGSYTLDGDQPTAYRPPGYVFFLAAFRTLGMNVTGLRWLNFLLLTLTLWIIYRLLSRLASPLAGFLGVVFGAGYVVLFFSAGTFYPQTLAAFLFMWVIERLVWIGSEQGAAPPRKLSYKSHVFTGVLFAWLVLTVPTFVFVLPVSIAWLLWRRRAWQPALGLAVVAALCLGTWTVRNLLILGEPVFVSTNSGENLLLGNSPFSSPDLGSQVDITFYRQQAAEQKMSEVERDSYFRRSAIDYWRSAPIAVLSLYFEKFLNYFNFRNDLATRSESSSIRDLLMLVTYYPLLLLGVWRVVEVLFVRRLPEGSADIELLLAFLYLGSALVQAVFFTRIRFRLPYDTLVIMLAALFVNQKLRQVMVDRSAANPMKL